MKVPAGPVRISGLLKQGRHQGSDRFMVIGLVMMRSLSSARLEEEGLGGARGAHPTPRATSGRRRAPCALYRSGRPRAATVSVRAGHDGMAVRIHGRSGAAVRVPERRSFAIGCFGFDCAMRSRAGATLLVRQSRIADVPPQHLGRQERAVTVRRWSRRADARVDHRVVREVRRPQE